MALNLTHTHTHTYTMVDYNYRIKYLELQIIQHINKMLDSWHVHIRFIVFYYIWVQITTEYGCNMDFWA